MQIYFLQTLTAGQRVKASAWRREGIRWSRCVPFKEPIRTGMVGKFNEDEL